MFGSAGSCLRAARGGQGTLKTLPFALKHHYFLPIFHKIDLANAFPWHQVLDGVPEGWCPALAVLWSGGVAGVAYRFHLKTDIFEMWIFVLNPFDTGRPPGGWARFIAATGQE